MPQARRRQRVGCRCGRGCGRGPQEAQGRAQTLAGRLGGERQQCGWWPHPLWGWSRSAPDWAPEARASPSRQFPSDARSSEAQRRTWHCPRLHSQRGLMRRQPGSSQSATGTSHTCALQQLSDIPGRRQPLRNLCPSGHWSGFCCLARPRPLMLPLRSCQPQCHRGLQPQRSAHPPPPTGPHGISGPSGQNGTIQ